MILVRRNLKVFLQNTEEKEYGNMNAGLRPLVKIQLFAGKLAVKLHYIKKGECDVSGSVLEFDF